MNLFKHKAYPSCFPGWHFTYKGANVVNYSHSKKQRGPGFAKDFADLRLLVCTPKEDLQELFCQPAEDLNIHL